MNATGFNAEQRRLLAAMGYTLLERRPPPPAAPADTLLVLEDGSPAVGPSPLLDALRAAFGLAAAREDGSFALPAGTGAGRVVDLAVLRADPKAKSTLWRHLRAVRRDPGGPGR
ncbi:MAG TPA: hypothetical protein VFG21_01235 [Xanthomonadaceae bacterium]|nr:hypothetical protein [Xanthomonadaceae bacterium]